MAGLLLSHNFFIVLAAIFFFHIALRIDFVASLCVSQHLIVLPECLVIIKGTPNTISFHSGSSITPKCKYNGRHKWRQQEGLPCMGINWQVEIFLFLLPDF